jgi:hypothetical protein
MVAVAGFSASYNIVKVGSLLAEESFAGASIGITTAA